MVADRGYLFAILFHFLFFLHVGPSDDQRIFLMACLVFINISIFFWSLPFRMEHYIRVKSTGEGIFS